MGVEGSAAPTALQRGASQPGIVRLRAVPWPRPPPDAHAGQPEAGGGATGSRPGQEQGQGARARGRERQGDGEEEGHREHKRARRGERVRAHWEDEGLQEEAEEAEDAELWGACAFADEWEGTL